MKDEAIYLYKYMKYSQLPRLYGHILAPDIIIKTTLQVKVKPGRLGGMAAEGPFLVDFPGGGQL